MNRVSSVVLRHFHSIPLFSTLSRRGLRLVAEAATEADVQAGTDLVREGEPDRDLFVVTRGEASVMQEGKRLGRVGPGEFFGELAFLTGEPRMATVRALTDMHVVVVRGRDLSALIEREPRLARQMMEAMARRLQSNQRLRRP